MDWTICPELFGVGTEGALQRLVRQVCEEDMRQARHIAQRSCILLVATYYENPLRRPVVSLLIQNVNIELWCYIIDNVVGWWFSNQAQRLHAFTSTLVVRRR